MSTPTGRTTANVMDGRYGVMSRQVQLVARDAIERARRTGLFPASPRSQSGIVLLVTAVLAVTAGTVSIDRSPHSLSLGLDLPGWTGILVVLPAVLAQWIRRRRQRARAGGNELQPSDVGTAESEVASGGVPAVVSQPLHHLLVKSGRTTTVVNAAQVARIEADGRYVRLVLTTGRTHLAQYTLAELEERLDANAFVRVHRSTIVALARVRRLRSIDYRDYEVVLDDGSSVRMSRTYRARMETALGALT
ncbi:MAG: LytTR family DNA-binding domain-containing protein [bacterium]